MPQPAAYESGLGLAVDVIYRVRTFFACAGPSSGEVSLYFKEKIRVSKNSVTFGENCVPCTALGLC